MKNFTNIVFAAQSFFSKKIKTPITFILAMLFLCMSNAAFATAYTSAVAGAVTTAANWTPAGVFPGVAGDTWTITLNMTAPAAGWTVNGSVSITAGKLVVANAAVINIGGNFSLSGATFINGGGAGRTYNIGGNLSLAGTSYMEDVPGYTTINLIGGTAGAPKTISCTSTGNPPDPYVSVNISTGAYYQLVTNVSGEPLGLEDGTTGFTINGYLDCQTFTLGAAAGTGEDYAFTISSGGTLVTAIATGINGSILAVDGTTFSGGANYVFDGATAQVTGNKMPNAFVSPGSVTINNASGVTLSQATTFGANDTVNLMNGLFTITPGLTFNTASGYIQRDNGTFSAAPTFSVAKAVNVNYQSLNYTGTPSTTSVTTGLELPTAATTLNNLTINKAGATITLAAAPTVNGNVGLTAGTLADAGHLITCKGNITGTATESGTAGITMTTGGSTISGATIGILNLNNAGGFSLSGSPTITSTLAFTSGILTTTAFYTITAPGAPGAVTGAGAGNYVFGTLTKNISTYSSLNYEVGDADYAPMLLTFSGPGTGGSLAVSSTNGAEPHAATSLILSTNIANHYWTITNNSATGPATITPKATYNLADILGGSNATFMTQEYGAATTAWLSSPLASTNNTSVPYSTVPTTGIALATLAGNYIYGSQAPTCTASPSSLFFGTIATSTTSAALSFAINAAYLTPVAGNLTVTAPANFQVSLTGTSGWGTTVSVPYTSSTLSSFPVFVEFIGPATAGSYSGNVTITGGGLLSTVNVPVTGISANPCSGTPTAGTSSISPIVGNSFTTFTLSLAGYSIGVGMTYQWQSSSTGTGGWANIPGATSPSYIFTGLSSATYYQCLVNCTNSGLSSTSTVCSAVFLSCSTTASSWLNNAITNTYSYIGATSQSWVVPLNVSSGIITATGATGGKSPAPSLGGAGGYVQGTTTVSATTTVNILVGGAGANAVGSGAALAKGGVTAGGTGGYEGGGGGGASDIRVGGTALANRVLVAAGGGGAGENCGETGAAEQGGYGGPSGGGGYECTALSTAYCGQGATTATFGVGATGGGFEPAGGNGSLGTGGNASVDYGGGGGAGYYGGGGADFGGGGGGSSYTSAAITSVTNTAAVNTTGNGVVTIKFTPLPESPSFGVDAFTVTAATGANLSDAGMAAAAAAGASATGYINRTALSPITLYTGMAASGVYASTITWGVATAYQEGQVWIDFNNDGAFQSTEEVSTVVGYSATSTTNPTSFNITIPALANPGSHLMRVRGILEYAGGTLALSSHLDPCLSQYGGAGPQYNDGDEADYGINIQCNTPAIGGTFFLCASGATTNLTNGVTGGIWTSSSSGIASVGTSGIVTGGTTPGTATISYTLSNGCAVGQVVTVNPVPSLTVTPSFTRCSLDAASALSAAGATSYLWVPTTFLSSSVISNPTTTATATVTYSVTGSIGTCSSVASVLVSVNPTPIVTVSSASAIYCSPGVGVSTVVSGAGAGGTYSWLPATFLSATTGTSPVATPTLTVIYTVTGTTVPAGCSSTATWTVNAAITPTITVTPSSALRCSAGTSTLLTASGATTSYSWLPTTGLSSAIIANPTTSVTGTTIYTVTGSSGVCSATATVQVSVNPTPTISGLNEIDGTNGPGSFCFSTSSQTAAYAYTGTTGSPDMYTLTWLPTGQITDQASYTALSSPIPVNIPSSAAANSYNGTLTIENSTTTCTNTATVTLTINALPVPSFPTQPGASSCSNTNVTYTTDAGEFFYTWGYYTGGVTASAGVDYNVISGGTFSDNTVTLQWLTTGPHSASVDYYNANSCDGTGYSSTTNVVASPTATVSNNGPLCVSGTATLTATTTTATNFAWTGPSSFTSTAQNPSVSPAATATYSLTVSNSGCSPTTVYTTTLTVNNPAAVVSNSGTICSVGTVSLTATPSGGVTTYLWAGANLSSTTAQNPTATPTVTSTYSLTVGLPGCNPATIYTTTVTVYAAPTAAVGNSGLICSGGTATLTATPSGGSGTILYAWSGPNLSSATAQNPTVTPTATATYSLTVSNAGCFPSTIYTTTVSVNPTPTAVVSNNGPICITGTATLTATPSSSVTSYLWSGASLSSTTVQNPTVTLGAAGTYTYSLTVSGGASPGCNPGTIYTTVVTVNTSASAAPSSNGPICIGATVALSANPAGGTAAAFTWAGANLSSTTAQNPTANPTSSAVYSLIVTGASGCGVSPTYTIAVTVGAQPSISALTSGNSNPFCAGSSIILTTTSTGGAGTPTYTWTGPDIIATTAATNVSPAISVSASPATGAYSVTVAYSGIGCITAGPFASGVYTLNAQPSVSALVSSASDPLCVGGIMTLTATSSGGAGNAMYTWAGPDITSGTSATNVSPSFTTAGAATSGAYSVTLAYDGSGCNTTSPFTSAVYTLNNQPVLTGLTSAISNPFCIGASIILNATSTGGAGTPNYTWAGPGVTTTTGSLATSPALLTAGGATSGAYSVTLAYNGTGCNTTLPFAGAVVYTLNAQPSVSALTPGISNPFCVGASITLTATATGGAGNPTYTWSGPDVTTTGSASNVSPALLTSGSATSGAYSVTLAYDGTGCNTTLPVASIVYTLNAQPSVSALTSSATNPLCVGGIMTLTATTTGGAGNATYTWAGPDITSGTSATNVSPSFTTAGSATSGAYSVTLAYDGAGCNTTAAFAGAVYTLNNQPVLTGLTSGISNPFCIGASITLTATSTGGAGTPNYTWAGPGVTTTTGASGTSPALLTAGGATSGAYSVTLAYNGTGCNTTLPFAGAVVYTLNAQPSVSALTSGISNPFCVGASITLTATATGGAGNPTYTWSGPDVTTTAGASNVSPALLTSGSATSGAYSVTLAYDGTGCNTTLPFASIVYTINAQPAISALTSSATNPLCVGGIMTLTATTTGGAGNATYTWAGPDITSGTSATNVSPSFSTAGSATSGAYSVTLAYDGTGCNTTATFAGAVYTLNNQPVLTGLTSGISNPFCIGASITLTATSTGGAGTPNYTWAGPDVTTTTGSLATSPALLTSGGATSGAYSVTLAYDGTGCNTTLPFAGAVVYTLNAQPSVSLLTSSATSAFCLGTSMNLTATSAGGAGNPTYTWSGPDITTVAGASNVSPLFTISSGPTTGAYSVTLAYDGTGCNTTLPVASIVYTIAPQPSMTSVTTTIANPFCAESVVVLTANGVTGGAGNPTYTWSGPALPTTTSSGNPASLTTTDVAAIGAYSVMLGFDGTGCNNTPVIATAITYTVQLAPATTIVSGAGTFCGSTTITASNGSDGTMYYQGTTSGGMSTAVPSASEVLTVTGTYYFRAQGAGGCWGDEGSATVIINPIPSAAPSNNSPVCVSGTATLSANPGANTNTYLWAGPALSSTTDQNPTATPAVSGAIVYTLTVSDGTGNPGCSPATQYFTTVTVNATPMASAANSGVICVTGTTTLTATTTGGTVSTYAWAGPNVTGGASSSTATAAPPGSGINEYTLTVTDGSGYSGCISQSVTDVTVNATPAASASNSGTICVTGTTTLTATTTGGTVSTYAWAGANVTSGATSSIATAAPPAAGINEYTLVVTDGTGHSGCMSQSVTDVNINATPTATASNSGTICVTGTATLTATTTGGTVSTYAWAGADVTGGATSSIATAAPPAAGINEYTLVVTDGTGNSGCMSQSVTDVNVNATPTAPASNSGTICITGTATLTATTTGGTVSTYAWAGPAILTGAGTATATADPTATGINEYTLVVTDGTGNSGCMSQSVTDVNVNATPAASVSNSGTICVTGTATLTATTTGGTVSTYAWTGANVTGGATSSIATAAPPAAGINEYTLVVTDGTGNSGCMSQSVTDVNVNATPAASASNSGTICVTGTATLTATTTGGTVSTYAWTGADVTGGASSSIATAAPPAAGVNEYTLVVTDGTGNSGCMSQSVTDVNVNATPTAPASNSGTICVTGTATLTATTTGGTVSTYAWAGPAILTGAGTATATADPTATGINEYTLVVTDGTGNSGCTSQSVTDVNVNATPAASASNSGTICVTGTATLTATTTGGTVSTYAWTGANVTGGATSSIATAAPPAAGINEYTLVVTDGTGNSGCMSQSTTDVSVNATPTVIASNSGYICVDGTVTVTATPSGGTVNTYAWAGAAILTGAGTATATADPTTVGINTYSVIVTDASGNPGCWSQSTTDVTVNPTPTAAPYNNGYICTGGTVMLIGNGLNGATTYMWSGPALTGSNVTDTTTATPTISGTTYTVTVTDGSGQPGCAPNTQYYTTVSVNPMPSVSSLYNTGYICNGGTVTLIALPADGANTYFWSGAALLSNTGENPQATPVATSIYTLTVSDGSGQPGCAPATPYYSTVTVHPAPAASPTSTSPICIGGTVTLYAEPLNGATTFSWSGANLTAFTTDTTSATPTVTSVYSVSVTDGSSQSGCSPATVYTTAVTVNSLPAVYNIEGSGTNYCAGTTGITIYLDGSDTGVDYQLYLGTYTIGGAVPGIGSLLNLGTETDGGDYIAIATDTHTGCTDMMSGSAPVIVNPLPTVYTATGGGPYCSGGVGATITLSGSGDGISYYLSNGVAPGSTLPGNDSALSYAGLMAAGSYTIVATNNITSCTSVMSGNPAITINPSPVAYSVSGSGAYCQGTGGLDVNVSASDTGVKYYLYNGSSLVSTIAGTGVGVLSFDGVTASGTYTVSAVDSSTGCITAMADSAVILMNPAPNVYSITGGGSYCAGNPGVNIGLGNSDIGITYTLYNAATSDTAVAGVPGAISFGTRPAGSYSVLATNNTTACNSVMSGTLVVTMNALPVVYNVTGGGSYCAGGAGVPVGLSLSQTGVKYRLYDGSSSTGTAIGTGAAFSFGTQTVAGTYTVAAVDTTSACGSNMADSAVVSITPLVTPSLSVSTGLGDTVCMGNTITFTATPVNGGLAPMYQWYVNAASVGVTTNAYSYVPVNGDVVKAILVSSAACATPDSASVSDTMTVNSNATPSVSVSADPGTTVCNGTSVTLTGMPVYGGALPTYNWYKNGIFVFAGTAYTYLPVDGDAINVVMTSNYPCAAVDTASANVTMHVGASIAPVVEIVASPGLSIAAGQYDTLTAFVNNTGGSTLLYQWVVNTTVITGATSMSYTSNAFHNNDSVTCQVTNNNGCNLEGDGSAKIHVFSVGIKPVTFGAADIKLLPNPNKGQFTLKGTLGTTDDEEVTMEVTDMIGQVVYKNKVVVHNGVINEQVQLSNTLANGMYMMNLHSNNGQAVFHFVVEQ